MADAAAYFGVAGRTARRWKAGTMDPPPGVWGGLLALEAVCLAPGLELHRLRPGEFLHVKSGIVFEVRPIEARAEAVEGGPGDRVKSIKYPWVLP